MGERFRKRAEGFLGVVLLLGLGLLIFSDHKMIGGLLVVTPIGIAIWFGMMEGRDRGSRESAVLAAVLFDVPSSAPDGAADIVPTRSPPSGHGPAVSSSPVASSDIRLEYRDFEGDVSIRRVTPSDVGTWKENDYAINGYCHLRGEERTFLLSRINELIVLDTGEVFDDPGDYLVTLGVPREQVPSYKRPEWPGAVRLLLHRVSAVEPLPDDMERIASVMWGLQKKTKVAFPRWEVPSEAVDVSEDQVRSIVLDITSLSLEIRQIIADAIGNFARGEGFESQHPRRIYARQLRSWLRPPKRPRGSASMPS